MGEEYGEDRMVAAALATPAVAQFGPPELIAAAKRYRPNTSSART